MKSNSVFDLSSGVYHSNFDGSGGLSLVNSAFKPLSSFPSQQVPDSVLSLSPNVEKLHTKTIKIQNDKLKEMAFKAISFFYKKQDGRSIDGVLLMENVHNLKIFEIDYARMCRVFKVSWSDSITHNYDLILKASIAGLPGGDLQAQALAQQLLKKANPAFPVPVVLFDPQVIGFNDDGEAIEMMAEEYINGQPATRLDSPEKLEKVFEQLGRLLRFVHSIDLSGYNDFLPPVWQHKDLNEQFCNCLNRLYELGELTRREHTLISRLELINDEPRCSIVHNDCHLGNILVDNGGNIVAIIDWAAATVDTRAAEIQYLLVNADYKGIKPAKPNSFHHSVPFNGRWSVINSRYHKEAFGRGYCEIEMDEKTHLSLLEKKVEVLLAHAAFENFIPPNMRNWRKLIMHAVREGVVSILDFRKSKGEDIQRLIRIINAI